MVDAQPIDRSRSDQFEHEPVRRIEHRLVLDAQRRELVHVEEASIVDLVRCDAPVRESVRLRFQQGMQGVERFRLSWHAVQRVHGGFDRLHERRRVRGELREAALVNFLVAIALGAPLRTGLIPRRKIAECREEARELLPHRFRDRVPVTRRRDRIQDRGVLARVGRKPVLVIPEVEGAGQQDRTRA